MDLVFQCPLQVSLKIPSHSPYSILKYSKVNAQRPVTATNKSRQECVEETIRENRQIKQKDTALKLGICKVIVGHIINLLGFQQCCAR